MEIFWASKSAYVGTHFFDSAIGLSLEERFVEGRADDQHKREVIVDKYTIQPSTSSAVSTQSIPGCSLGPNWLAKLKQESIQHQVSL